jgi:hypothetical protein
VLRVSNGGDGDLALPPLMFVPDSLEDIIDVIFFGGDGGLERIALDCRAGLEPWPIVMAVSTRRA